MLSRSFPRFLLEVGLLVAAAAVSAVAHLEPIMIALVMAGAFGVVVLSEWLLTRGVAEPPARQASGGVAPDRRPRWAPRRHPREPAGSHAAAFPPVPGDRSGRPRQPAAAKAPPAVASVSPAAAERLRAGTLQPDDPPSPTVTRPDRDLAVSAAPVAGATLPRAIPAPLPAASARRRWNVFELQDQARLVAGADVTRDEELSFLLLYLREFADLDGELPEEFDGFVRESFTDLMR